MTRLNLLTRDMNQDTFINRLLEAGLIIRHSRGWYMVPSSPDLALYNRRSILDMFGEEIAPGRHVFKEEVIEMMQGSVAQPQPRPIRTIERHSYHSQHRYIYRALERIPYDADGVRRSYGIEFEINALTREQESELAYLLDTLPPHVTERDGSLSSTGVEIIFQPMSKEDAIKTVKTLQRFVEEHNIDMDGTGMHITYGVSNSEVSEDDLVIRLNRLALAVKAVGRLEAIREMFGRDFLDTDYARLPNSLTSTARHRAFNVRNAYAWECRLINWKCNIEKIMKFFEVTEVLFHRPFEAQDFMKVFELLGADTNGA